jgi:hypothetical protein
VTGPDVVGPRPGEQAAIEALCKIAHDAYERAAVVSGWTTNDRSRVEWADVPPETQAATRAAVLVMLLLLPARDEQAKIDNAVQAVLDLHQSDGDFCKDDGFVWPCRTVRAVTTALGATE